MPPFGILRIDHLVLRVLDLERSVAFYEAALGCTVVLRREELGLVHLRAGTSMIDLVAVSGPLGSSGGAAPGIGGRNVDHLCLRVEPFDEAEIRAHLLACGAPAHGKAAARFGAEGVGPSLYFADPDGNVIELKGAAETPLA
jgi:catechol 2,3-dioxygenase-like lactoylglutathione lyase family enzyme